MRRPRRRVGRRGSNHLSISARNAEWDEVRARAERVGLPIARYVKRLVERDLSRGGAGFIALAPAEQRELLEAVREIRALLREDAAMTMRDGGPAAGAATPPAPKTREQAGSAEPDEGTPRQGRLF